MKVLGLLLGSRLGRFLASAALSAPVINSGMPVPSFRAIVISPANVCDSRLDFLHVFERPSLTRILFEGVIVVRGTDDARVTASYIHSRMELPTLLLYDDASRLRMAIEAPKTAESADLLVAWLADRAMR
jgi:hypothetical protein